MAKQKFKSTNWKIYNDALRQQGSLAVWLSDDAVAAWYEEASSKRRGMLLHYTDSAITTALMLKSVFHLNFLALQGFIDSFFHRYVARIIPASANGPEVLTLTS